MFVYSVVDSESIARHVHTCHAHLVHTFAHSVNAYVKFYYSLYVRTFSFAKSGAIGMMKNIQNFIFQRLR